MYYHVSMHYGLQNHSPLQGVVSLTINFTTCLHHDLRHKPLLTASALSSPRDLLVMHCWTSPNHTSIPSSCFKPYWFVSFNVSKVKGRAGLSQNIGKSGVSLTNTLFWCPIHCAVFSSAVPRPLGNHNPSPSFPDPGHTRADALL